MIFCSVLSLSVLPCKCQVSAVAGALFGLNVHCEIVFSCSDEQDVHLMAEGCPFVVEG